MRSWRMNFYSLKKLFGFCLFNSNEFLSLKSVSNSSLMYILVWYMFFWLREFHPRTQRSDNEKDYFGSWVYHRSFCHRSLLCLKLNHISRTIINTLRTSILLNIVAPIFAKHLLKRGKEIDSSLQKLFSFLSLTLLWLFVINYECERFLNM